MLTGCIGLGGNVGDVAATFAAALKTLPAHGILVRRVSPLYRTQPIGPDAGAAFLNACAVIDTELSADRLLSALLAAEDSAGRRRVRRWGERTLDLDLLLLGDLVLASQSLVVPHPGVCYRRFVLDPLADIAAQFAVPPTERTVAGLHDRLLRRPLPIRIGGGRPEERARLRAFLHSQFPSISIEPEDADSADGAEDPTMLLLPEPPHEHQSRPLPDAQIVVRLEPHLESLDAAAAAIIAAMLDAPVRIGEVPQS